MPLIALTYVSRPLIGASGPELKALSMQCVRNNRTLGVTGALYFDGQQFFQVIESHAKVVDALFSRILADGRHRDVRRLQRVSIAARRFPAWDMKIIDGRYFAHLRNHFAFDRLQSADSDGIVRRARLLEQLDDAREGSATAARETLNSSPRLRPR